MKGCLTKDEGGTYLLQTRHSARVKLDTTEDLSPQVGQLVKVTGTFVDTHPENDGGRSRADQSHANSSMQPHSTHAFRVFKVDVLSQTCSARKK